MPRPKPPEPYVSIVLRLTPGQAEKVRSWAKDHGQTVSDTFRAFVDQLGEKAARPVPKPVAALSRPKAAPGSRLKKR